MMGKERYRFFFGFFCSFFIAVPLDIATSITTLHTGKVCLMIADSYRFSPTCGRPSSGMTRVSCIIPVRIATQRRP
jgi:hypothetical protein